MMVEKRKVIGRNDDVFQTNEGGVGSTGPAHSDHRKTGNKKKATARAARNRSKKEPPRNGTGYSVHASQICEDPLRRSRSDLARRAHGTASYDACGIQNDTLAGGPFDLFNQQVNRNFAHLDLV